MWNTGQEMLGVGWHHDGIDVSFRDQDRDLEPLHDGIAVDGAGEHPETSCWRYNHTGSDQYLDIFLCRLLVKQDSH